MEYNVTNLDSLYDALGEKKLQELLNEFECPKNIEVDKFLKEKAILLSKQGISKTYIVTAAIHEENVIVGYFSIASKMTKIKKDFFGGRTKRRFERFAETTKSSNMYFAYLPLIGQLGKNFRNGYDKYITGDVLLHLACKQVCEVQKMIGGRFVFLECEDIPKLKNFYESNGFMCYNIRKLDKYESENNVRYLLQMICDLSNF